MKSRGTVGFYIVRYTKGDLEIAGEEKAVVFLLACQLHNDIGSLFRILLSNSNGASEKEPLAASAISIQLLVIRMLSGRLYEGWNALTGKNSITFAGFQETFSDDAKGDWIELKKYFGSGQNLIPRLRNKVAFHSDTEVFADGFRRAASDLALVDFHQLAQGNTVYHSADEMLFRAMMEATGKDEPYTAMKAMHDEIHYVAGRFLNVANAVAKSFADKYLTEQLKAMRDEYVEVFDQPGENSFDPNPFIYVPGPRRPNMRRSKLLDSASAGPLATPPPRRGLR